MLQETIGMRRLCIRIAPKHPRHCEPMARANVRTCQPLPIGSKFGRATDGIQRNAERDRLSVDPCRVPARPGTEGNRGHNLHRLHREDGLIFPRERAPCLAPLAHQMAYVLSDDSLPADMGVGIEFGIPQTAKRIDFILSGLSEAEEARATKNSC